MRWRTSPTVIARSYQKTLALQSSASDTVSRQPNAPATERMISAAFLECLRLMVIALLMVCALLRRRSRGAGYGAEPGAAAGAALGAAARMAPGASLGASRIRVVSEGCLAIVIVAQ